MMSRSALAALEASPQSYWSTSDLSVCNLKEADDFELLVFVARDLAKFWFTEGVKSLAYNGV